MSKQEGKRGVVIRYVNFQAEKLNLVQKAMQGLEDAKQGARGQAVLLQDGPQRV